MTFSSSASVRFSPGSPGSELARRAVGAGLEARIAPAALAALRDLEFHAGALQVAELLAGIGIASPRCRPAPRRTDPRRCGRCSRCPSRPRPTCALIGALDAKIGQRVDALGRAQPARCRRARHRRRPDRQRARISRAGSWREPRPPLPACTRSVASSTNFIRPAYLNARRCGAPQTKTPARGRGFEHTAAAEPSSWQFALVFGASGCTLTYMRCSAPWR